MTEFVRFSMGICSAYIACRLKDEGRSPQCVWSDTRREDDDTYRFGWEVVRRWGLDVVDASDGRDMWEVFRGEHFIPVRQVSMCSRIMKIKPSNDFFKSFTGNGSVAFGYELGEEDRAESLLQHWKHPHLLAWFPLIEWQITKEQCFGYFLQHDVAPPQIYQHFQHANCLPCKNFKLKDWIALGYHYPEKFREAMEFEEAEGLHWIQEGTALRDVLAMVPSHPPSRKGRRKLAMATPAFDFTMGCDACAVG